MPKTPEDYPVSIGHMEDDAEGRIDSTELVDAVIILGQLDPLEVLDGKPRWSENQQVLIMRCVDQVAEWQDS